jgi:hypothetical protein
MIVSLGHYDAMFLNNDDDGYYHGDDDLNGLIIMIPSIREDFR